jgi:hypothetical protein
VYQVDRIGPLKDFTFFHTGCFKCKACGSKLTLKSYFNNQNSQDDKEVSLRLSAQFPIAVAISSPPLIHMCFVSMNEAKNI